MREFALFSTWQKEGIGSLARALMETGLELVATGKTRSMLQDEGLKVMDISELTQEPERFGGRLKTLHHKVMGGILFRPGQDEVEWPYDFRIAAVVCNFYPFKEKAVDAKTMREMIEWIDIGGPTMVRAAAKNFEHVWIFTQVEQYSRFIAKPATELSKADESLRLKERFALEAFESVRELDESIVEQFQFRHSAQLLSSDLVYGENPHQEASFHPNNRAGLKFLGNPSFNNLRDTEAALRFVLPFHGPAVSIIKHQTLCGAAAGIKGSATDRVFNWAWEGDPVSRFGSVIAMNFLPTPSTTEVLLKKFIEVLVLPRTEASLAWADAFRAQKERVRIVLLDPSFFGMAQPLHQEVFLGFLGKLKQKPDYIDAAGSESNPKKLLEVFGEWSASCSKSNAIILAGWDLESGCAYLAGTGQGQPNRIDALKILAIPRAKDFARRMGVPFETLTCFSDGFIPFTDSLKELHAAGIRRFVQPGGSKADGEVVEAAREFGIDMRMTGTRHFWH